MAGPELKADASVTPAALHANPASCLRVPEHMSCYDRQDLPAPQQDGRAAGVRQQTWLKESQTVYNPAASPTDRYGRFG